MEGADLFFPAAVRHGSPRRLPRILGAAVMALVTLAAAALLALAVGLWAGGVLVFAA